MTEPAQQPELILYPHLPLLRESDVAAVLEAVTDGLPSLRQTAHRAFTACLDEAKTKGWVLAYTDESAKYKHLQPSCQLRDGSGEIVVWNQEVLKLDHLVLSGFMNVGFLCYSVVVPSSGPRRSPVGVAKYTENPSFVDTTRPWGVFLSQWSQRHLRTRDRFRFGLWVRLRFPLLDTLSRPASADCQHRFLLRPLGVWEWRLVWECKICGILCHCTCFEQAIRQSPFSRYELGRHREIPLRSLPFLESACDVCRGVPSTNEFCHEMYARSDFERRYGAYVAKRLVEEGVVKGDPSYEATRRSCTDDLRNELGFRKIGERFVSETELFHMVQAVFTTEEVIHHHRAAWLQGQELDIFVPGRSLGVEYHGVQHFESVPAWGGEAALVLTQERDMKKALLCRANGVTLVVFTHEEDLSVPLVRLRLSDALGSPAQEGDDSRNAD